jgi:hypothetical protein
MPPHLRAHLDEHDLERIIVFGKLILADHVGACAASLLPLFAASVCSINWNCNSKT